MKPEDKKTLQQAFRDAVAKSPNADKPVPGLIDDTGKTLTQREAIEQMLATEDFYSQVDSLVASGQVTLNQFVKVVAQKISGGPTP